MSASSIETVIVTKTAPGQNPADPPMIAPHKEDASRSAEAFGLGQFSLQLLFRLTTRQPIHDWKCSEQERLWTIRRAGQEGRRNAAGSGAAEDRIRIQVGSAPANTPAGSDDVLEEFPQAHRRLGPRRYHPAPDRLHGPVQPRADRRRDAARPDAGQVRTGRSAVVHEIFTQHVLQGRPVLDRILDGPIDKIARYKCSSAAATAADGNGDRPFAEVLAEKLRAAGLTAEQGSHHTGELLRRVQRGRGGPLLAPAGSGPTRCCTVWRTKPISTRIIREHFLKGRPVVRLESAGQDRRAEVPGALRRRRLLQPPKPRRPAA